LFAPPFSRNGARPEVSFNEKGNPNQTFFCIKEFDCTE
jgi:hypothetical protein